MALLGARGGGQGAASECQKLLSFFFFSVLDKQRNCIQADGDREINCVTRLVCRTWFRYHVAEMADLILNLRQADPHRLVDGQGKYKGPGPLPLMVTEQWTRSPLGVPSRLLRRLRSVSWLFCTGFPRWCGAQVSLLLCSLRTLSSPASAGDDVCTLMTSDPVPSPG